MRFKEGEIVFHINRRVAVKFIKYLYDDSSAKVELLHPDHLHGKVGEPRNVSITVLRKLTPLEKLI